MLRFPARINLPTVSTDPSNHFDDSVKLFFPSNNFTQSPERLHDSSFHPSFFSLFSFHTSTSKQRITLNNSFHQKVCIFIYTFFVSFVSHTFVSFTEKLMVHHERIVSNSERKKKIVAILSSIRFLFFRMHAINRAIDKTLDPRNLENEHRFGGDESAGLPVSKAREKCTLRPAALAFIDARANARKRTLSLSLFPSPLSSCSPSSTRSVPPSSMLSRVSPVVCVPRACTHAPAQSADKDASHRL